MLRIALIIALVAGIAATALNFIKVRERIVLHLNERDQFHKERDEQTDLKNKSITAWKQTSNTLFTTQAELTQTKDSLDKAQAEVTTQKTKIDELSAELTTTKANLTEANQKLAAWEAVGITVDQIKAMIVELKRTQEERDAYIDEKRILLRKNNALAAELNALIGVNQEVALPPGLKGRVLAVDPKYDFVVLDIGSNQGVLQRGEMLINRRGKLIGKVRIISVEPNQSVANVLPGWKNGEVLEGDQVLY